jgi:hypothetical protein
VEEGDVIWIPDRLTGFDDNKPSRPYVVVRVVGDPPVEIYVVPRTTERTHGTVEVPAGVVPSLEKGGWFLFRAYRLAAADVADTEPVGRLPEPYRDTVLEQANLAEFDID